jgi:hypothetical protein
MELNTSNIVDLVSKLLHSTTQVKVAHWQSLSYSQHMVLDGYYNSIQGLNDGLIEVIQGKSKSIVKGFKSYPITDNVDPIKYMESLKQSVETYRLKLPKEFDNINNQLQMVIDLIELTIYKLTFLK